MYYININIQYYFLSILTNLFSVLAYGKKKLDLDIIKRQSILSAVNNEQVHRFFPSASVVRKIFLATSSPIHRPLYDHLESTKLSRLNSIASILPAKTYLILANYPFLVSLPLTIHPSCFYL